MGAMTQEEINMVEYTLRGSFVKKVGKSFFKDGNKLGKRKSKQVGSLRNHRFVIGATGSSLTCFDFK